MAFSDRLTLSQRHPFDGNPVHETALAVDVRGKNVATTVEGMPFYSRKRKKKAPGGAKE